MPKALSVDLRDRVVRAIDTGLSRHQAAARFGVSVSSAVRWHQHLKATGSVVPKKQGGNRRSKAIEAHADFLRDQVAETPDLTLAELQEKLGARGLKASTSAIDRFFKRHRITYKKRQRMPASRSETT